MFAQSQSQRSIQFTNSSKLLMKLIMGVVAKKSRGDGTLGIQLNFKFKF